MANILQLIIDALWFILPAYFANASPVIGAKLLGKYNYPMDFNIKIRSKPLLGPGKTWGGFLTGILVGSAIGFLQARPLAGFLLSLGALIGDAFGSFIKRRLGLERGKSFPLLDQLGFVVFALLFVSFVELPTLPEFAAILILTPAIHLGTNAAAYLLKLKKEWY